MLSRLLLDTHIVLRWLSEPKRLSRDQARVLDRAHRHAEGLALSAITLVEVAILAGARRLSSKESLSQIFDTLQGDPAMRILPLTFEIADEVASLGVLKDPVDRMIVATARVHRLQLVTSDQRIIESGLVSVVE